MDLPITVLFRNKPTVSDIIVFTLLEEYPLSVKELYFRIRNRHNRKVTLQAVYKAVVKLEQERILRKQERFYELDLGWVRSLRESCTLIIEGYSGESRIDEARSLINGG